jgi:hypothetical protein
MIHLLPNDTWIMAVMSCHVSRILLPSKSKIRKSVTVTVFS